MWEGALAPFEGEGGAPPAPLPGSLPYQHAACLLLLALCVRLLVRRLRHRHRALLAADCVSLSSHRAAAMPPLSGWRAVSERCGRASTRLRALARSFVAPAELADAVLTLAEQLEAQEAQVARSSQRLEKYHSMLHQRAGLIASLLEPTDDLAANASGEAHESTGADAALQQRKLAEMATLLLDILNWKLGQGPPLARAHFWRAFAVCEALVRDVAPSEEAASATGPQRCSSGGALHLGAATHKEGGRTPPIGRQLQQLVLEFDLTKTGVPLQWRWRRTPSSSPSSDARAEQTWLLQLNRQVPLSTLLLETEAEAVVPAGTGGAWLVAEHVQPRVEELLELHRRKLWRVAASRGRHGVRVVTER